MSWKSKQKKISCAHIGLDFFPRPIYDFSPRSPIFLTRFVFFGHLFPRSAWRNPYPLAISKRIFRIAYTVLKRSFNFAFPYLDSTGKYLARFFWEPHAILGTVLLKPAKSNNADLNDLILLEARSLQKSIPDSHQFPLKQGGVDRNPGLNFSEIVRLVRLVLLSRWKPPTPTWQWRSFAF